MTAISSGGRYILAHDLGTSMNKATLYGTDGVPAASATCAYPTYYPFAGAVEQDPDDWMKAVCVTTRALLDTAGVSPGDIAAISFSGQMMGCLAVDRAGEKLYNHIIWADLRAVKQAERMERLIGGDEIYNSTGHRVSASYSAAKLLWLKDNLPEVYQKTYKILHAKDYIIHRLTGRFVTDYSDASGMNFFDLKTLDWNRDILSGLGIDISLLPELHRSADVVGGLTTGAARLTGLPEGTPVVAGGGDGSCACVGAGVVAEGRMYNVIGSSSWISKASKEPADDPLKRVFTWVHLDETLLTPCGTMQTAGYAVSWLRDTLCQMEKDRAAAENVSPYKFIDDLAQQSTPGAGGALFLPYLLGERSPRWNPNATASFQGLRMTSARADMVRAVLEGVGYNLKVILELLKGPDTASIVAIGGGAKSGRWLQMLSDIWQCPIEVPRYLEEATSIGAAVCGGVGIGAFADFSVIGTFNPIVKTVMPDGGKAGIYANMYERFNEAYAALEPFYALG